MALSIPPPTRVAIGYVSVQGQRLEVFLDPEWARYLSSLNAQVVTIGNAVGQPGSPGTTGAAGVGVSMSDEEGSSVEFIPGPRGEQGPSGACGAAFYMLRDDAASDMPMGRSTSTTEAFIAPTLTNSWVDYGAPYNTTGYFKDGSGVVHLRGTIKSGTMSAAAFTLPAGYRPTATEQIANYSGTGAGLIQIDSAGQVVPVAGVNTDQRLDGLTFRAA